MLQPNYLLDVIQDGMAGAEAEVFRGDEAGRQSG